MSEIPRSPSPWALGQVTTPTRRFACVAPWKGAWIHLRRDQIISSVVKNARFHGKIMGKSWEHHGKIMGTSWENHGKIWGHIGKYGTSRMNMEVWICFNGKNMCNRGFPIAMFDDLRPEKRRILGWFEQFEARIRVRIRAWVEKHRCK